MILKKRRMLLILAAILIFPRFAAADLEPPMSGSFIVPEYQSGFSEEQYEVQTGRKLQRGLENFFLSPLEVPHGVKKKYEERKAEYLTMGIEPFFLGTLQGFGRGFVRAGVGLYEVFSFPYPQGPILEDMNEWVY